MRAIGRTVLLVLVLLSGPASRPGAEENRLYPDGVLAKFGAAARALAKGGRSSETTFLIDRLVELGYSSDRAGRLRTECERNARLAASRPDPRAHERAARIIRKELRRLAAGLDDLPPTGRPRAARVLLTLDADCAPAHRALGHVEDEGVWTSPEEARLRLRRAALRMARRTALSLPVEVKSAGPADAIVVAATGEKGSRVACGAIEIQGPWSAPRLTRILRASIRATALAGFLLRGECLVPSLPPSRFYLVRTEKEYRAALAEFHRRGDTDAEAFEDQKDLACAWIRGENPLVLLLDSRTEAAAAANLVYWLLHESAWTPERPERLGDARVCLREGLASLVCLSAPGVDARPHAEPLAGLAGLRRRLSRLVRDGRDPPWFRTMVGEADALAGDARLKATSVVEYLAERGDLVRLLAATFPAEGDERPETVVFEKALGEPLGSLETGWRRWMLRDRPAPDLLARIEGRGGPPRLTPEQADGLEHLNLIRRRLGLRDVDFDLDLAAVVAGHARSLAGERPDRPALEDGTIVTAGETVEATIDSLMETVHARLTLLHPGLRRVAWGTAKGLVVIDATSFVAGPRKAHVVAWPCSGTKGVPTRHRPEHPDPVAGRKTSDFGHPVTVQVWRRGGAAPEWVSASLHEGQEDGPVVDCHLSTPDAPLNPESASPNAYVLLPKRPLKPGSRYTVVATVRNPAERLVWTFLTGK